MVESLSCYIDTERTIFEKANTNAIVEVRLNKASSILRSVIIQIWATKKFITLYKPKQSEKLIELLLKNLTYNPVDSSIQIFDPTALNCVKTLNHLLKIQCFRDHLYLTTSESILNVSIQCLRPLVSDTINSSKNENLLVELFTSVYEILNPSYTSNTILFQSAKATTGGKYYLKFYQILSSYFKNIFEDSKRERESLIFVFKIMNKCMIDMAATDINLCRAFYRLGIKFILEVKTIISRKLVSELAIFFNLIGPYISPTRVSKNFGDSGNSYASDESTAPDPKVGISSEKLGSEALQSVINPSSEADESLLLSDLDGSFVNDPIAPKMTKKRKRWYGNEIENTPSIQEINDLSKVIEIGLNLFNDNSLSKPLELETESVSLHIFPNTHSKNNLFSARFMYLRKGFHSTPWLLRLGLVRLIISFYELKTEFVNAAPDANFTNASKRLRITGLRLGSTFQLSDHIKSFENPLDCLLSLLVDDPFKNGILTITISQLLAFFFEYISSKKELITGDKLLCSILSNRVQILDELMIVFERPENQLKFWILFSINIFYSITANLSNERPVDLQTEKSDDAANITFNKLLKYCLELLKDPNICKLSCVFLSHFSLYNFSSGPKMTHLDKTIIQQYENIIDLSEINGPAKLCYESVLFWSTTINICKNFKFKNVKLNNSSRDFDPQLYSHKISYWFTGKIEQLSTLCNAYDIFSITMFVCWISELGSLDISAHDMNNMEETYDGHSNKICLEIAKQARLSEYILKSRVVDSQLVWLNPCLNIKEETLVTNDVTRTRVRFSFINFMESLIDQAVDRRAIEWCLAMCIFLNEPHMDYTDIVERFTINLKDYFQNKKNDKSFHILLHKLFDAFNDVPIERKAWVSKVANIIEFSDLMEASLCELSSTDKSFNSLEFELLDSFMPTTKSELSDESFPNYSVYNIANLSHDLTLEQKATKLFLKLSFVHDDVENALETTLDFTSRIKSKFQYIAAQLVILQFLETKNVAGVSEQVIDIMFSHLTCLLEDHMTKTNECSLILITKTFSIFCKRWMHSQTPGINSDGKAVYEYLTNLYRKNMLYTESVLIEYFCFSLQILNYFNMLTYEVDEKMIWAITTEIFTAFSNFNKCQVGDSIKFFIRNTQSDKFDIYSSFVKSFKDPQKSMESSATFCFFMTRVSAASETLAVATVCNLLEISNYAQINLYLPYAIRAIITTNNISSVHALFWNFKEVFFKCWGSFEFSIEEFPFELFEFSSLDDFFLASYKEIAALSLAYNHKSVVPKISKITNMQESSVVNDSMALSITLSWTKGGIKNKIFKSFEKYFTSSRTLKANMAEQFLLIIFQLFRFCDCSSENELKKIFKNTKNENHQNDLFLENSQRIAFLDEYELSIKPKNCIDMINYFADICKVEEIWTVPTVYHLASKILLLIDSSILLMEKKMHMRRLKLLYMIGSTGFANARVCELITRSLTPYLKDKDLMDDAAGILNCVLCENSESLSNISIEVWVLILSCLMNGPHCRQISNLHKSFSRFQPEMSMGKYTKMLNFGLSTLDNDDRCPVPDLVEFINTSCEDTKNTYTLIKYLSLLFEKSISLPLLKYDNMHHSMNHRFIQNLYDIKVNFADELSSPMVLWIGKCLGIYYQFTGRIPERRVFEYDSYMMRQNGSFEFNKIVKSLDIIFELMIADLPSSNPRTRYCFETIIGVILYKKNVLQEDITSYVSYDELFKPFENFIYPMGNYMCSLLIDQVENDNLTYYRHGLEEALNGFSTNIRAYKLEKWLTQILFSIINELSSHTSIIILLANYICHISSFSFKCFCPLVLYFIENQPIKRGNLIGRMVHDFFEEDMKKVSKEAIQLFVELVLLIRIGTKNGNDKFVNISRHFDIPPIYEAALYIKKNKAALMLFEDYYSSVDFITREEVLNNPIYNKYLKEAYEGIEDKDLVFGLPIVPELCYGLEILKNNDLKWGEMMFNNAKFESNLLEGNNDRVNCVSNITSGMMELGWSGVSNIMSEHFNELSNNEKGSYSDMFYEQLWKLNQWDISASNDFLSENKCIYSILKQIKDFPFGSKKICEESIEKLVKTDIKLFKKPASTSTESLESWVRTLSLCNIFETTTAVDESFFEEHLKNFHDSTTWFESATVSEFENLLLGRRSLLELMSNFRKPGDHPYLYIPAEKCWLGVVSELHVYNHLMTQKEFTQKAINASVYLDQIATQKFSGNNILVNRIAKFNLAKAFWTQQSDTRFPVETLKDIIKKDKSLNLVDGSTVDGLPQISPVFIIATLAQWSDECKQETSATIMQNYIEPTVQQLNDFPGRECDDLGLTYHIMAKFCDDQIKKEQDDTLMEKLRRSIINLEHDIKSLTKFLQEETRKERKRYALQDLNRLKIRYKAKSKELAASKKERDVYIEKAIGFYFRSIALDTKDQMESDVDRFCSLWIEHSDINIDENELLQLPSSCFVPWNNQLTSRLLDENTVFQSILKKLIINISLAHPFHILYLIKSLIITKNESDDAAVASRGAVAESIWEILHHSADKFNVQGIPDILNSIDVFADKAVAIANSKLKNMKKASILKFPDGRWWIDILPTLSLPSPVKNIAVQKHLPYRKEKLSVILRIDDSIVIAASGISHPKIMKMVLSTGETQRMLLKAPDDLRQDSIMKQVFEKVNKLLWRNIETRKRKLRIRTYNVLPLGPTSGVLEFVPNSMPLIDILKPLHQGDEMDINEARLKMKEFQGQSKTVRYQAYKEICQKISPSLRIFFFNNFTSSDSWYESRTLYSHGIASTSITGYILGIGDRHCNNILLDKASGEPIHIDFGVAFDQGQALPIPETVPFRLTRDIVDGLGIAGVNGMFSKSCEHVLKVLRNNTQYICGILDVLKYDPLYSWTLSPLRKKKLQQIYFNNDESDKGFDEFIKTDTGSEANAAIDTVKRKLIAKGLSNEAVVRELIHEAVDPKNLALIFMGWSPFL